jgi:hypothetical protein
MKTIILFLSVLMAGGFDNSEIQNGLQDDLQEFLEPPPPPNSPSEEGEPEEVNAVPRSPLLERISSGEITVDTDRIGEGNSPKQLLAINGKITPPPQRAFRKTSHFNPAELSVRLKE